MVSAACGHIEVPKSSRARENKLTSSNDECIEPQTTEEVESHKSLGAGTPFNLCERQVCLLGEVAI